MRTLENIRRFRLSDTFIEPYKQQEVPWGPLGYVTFKRTYARRLNEFDPDAVVLKSGGRPAVVLSRECSICKSSTCLCLVLEWNDNKAQRTAKDAYDRLFTLKWTPSRSRPVDDGNQVCRRAHSRRIV
jgi:ribonucleoside-triphosphate reductase